ncbi:MAG: tetratricopeptide repeat protein, partial [Thermodesulfobacteriota bacterium]
IWPARMDVAQGEKGAALYRKALENDPNHFEAAWKLSRNLCWVAEHVKGDKRLKAATEAVEAAKKAVELRPDDPAGYFFLGLSYGYYGEAKGFLKTMFLAKPIEEAFNKVLELDPTYQCGGAYVALGRGYYFLPGYMDRAVEYYRKAMDICPLVFGAHLFLAQAYIKKGRKEEARALLNRILEGPSEPGWEPEYKEWREEAEYYLIKVREMK